jgi:hypothetical protein
MVFNKNLSSNQPITNQQADKCPVSLSKCYRGMKEMHTLKRSDTNFIRSLFTLLVK